MKYTDLFTAFATTYSGRLSAEATYMLRRLVNVDFSPEGSGYYCTNFKSNYYIHIGFKTYTSQLGVAPKDTVKDPITVTKHMAPILLGAFYHEVSHCLFTDFDYTFKIIKKYPNDFGVFLKNMMNVLEDIYIEPQMAGTWGSAPQYITALKKFYFNEASWEAIKPTLEEETVGSLMNYILIYYRNPEIVDKEHVLFTKYKEYILDQCSLCTRTVDPLIRTQRQFNFAASLWKLVKGEIQEPPKPEESEGQEGMVSGPSDTSDSSVGESKLGDPTEASSSSSHEPIPVGPATSKEAPGITTLDPDNMIQIANSCNDVSFSNHTWFDMAVCQTSKSTSLYDGVVAKRFTEINSLVSVIKRLKAINNTATAFGQSRGKLSSHDMMRRDGKVFKTKTNPKPEADLAVSLIIDNSGSMSGNRSKVAAEAAVILAEVLNRLKIPYEVHAFSENYKAETAIIKGFTHNHDSRKPYYEFMLAGSSKSMTIKGYSPFYGNSDEINISNIYRQFRDYRNKDKMVIVLSDGGTCGSKKVLQKLVASIEKECLIIGIGLNSTEVESIYSNTFALKTSQDLVKLPKLLGDILKSHIFK